MVNNKVILMGRLTRDAKIMDSKGEDEGKMATFSLAVDKMRKKQEPGAGSRKIKIPGTCVSRILSVKKELWIK